MSKEAGSGEPRAEKKHESISEVEARAILGSENVFGAAELQKVFGVSLEKIPPIRFSKELLRNVPNARLILCSKEIELEGVKVAATAENLKKKFPDSFQGVRQLTEDPALRTVAARSQWFLVRGEALPDSRGKNLLEQTDLVAQYVEELLREKLITDNFNHGPILERALKDYSERRAGIAELMNRTPHAGQKEIYQLGINQLTGLAFAEAMELHLLTRTLHSSPAIARDGSRSPTIQYPVALTGGYAITAMIEGKAMSLDRNDTPLLQGVGGRPGRIVAF